MKDAGGDTVRKQIFGEKKYFSRQGISRLQEIFEKKMIRFFYKLYLIKLSLGNFDEICVRSVRKRTKIEKTKFCAILPHFFLMKDTSYFPPPHILPPGDAPGLFDATWKKGMTEMLLLVLTIFRA